MKKIIQHFVLLTAIAFGMVSFAYAQNTSLSFNVSLGHGSTNKAEVLKLQNFLFDNGYLHVTPTGLFLGLTQKALSQFQQNQGISPLGYFGPLTRSVANKVALAKQNSPTVTTLSVANTDNGTATTILSNEKTVTWQTNNYPQGVGVNINLIRKTSDFPKIYDLVRTLVKDTPNDGVEKWIPGKGETGNDMYIQVTCSSTFSFVSGCKLASDPIKVS